MIMTMMMIMIQELIPAEHDHDNDDDDDDSLLVAWVVCVTWVAVSYIDDIVPIQSACCDIRMSEI